MILDRGNPSPPEQAPHRQPTMAGHTPTTTAAAPSSPTAAAAAAMAAQSPPSTFTSPSLSTSAPIPVSPGLSPILGAAPPPTSADGAVLSPRFAATAWTPVRPVPARTRGRGVDLGDGAMPPLRITTAGHASSSSSGGGASASGSGGGSQSRATATPVRGTAARQMQLQGVTLSASPHTPAADRDRERERSDILETPSSHSILSHAPVIAPTDQPEFAELLTPAQLRRPPRRRRPQPVGLGNFAGQAILAGASGLGYTTGDGDLYRGAARDPSAPAKPSGADDEDDEDDSTLSSGSSGSSSWSWGSGLEHGRRATMAVVQRFGEAIGVRRGSVSSGSSTESDSDDSSSNRTSRVSRFGRALTRTMSRATTATNDSQDDRPRRVYVPRRREFTLLTPPGESKPSGLGRDDSFASLSSSRASTPKGYLDAIETASQRVMTTPMLPSVLEAVRNARAIAGVVTLQPDHLHHTHHPTNLQTKKGGHTVPIRRGGSAPGRVRSAAPGGFTLPTVPRPVLVHSHSRVDTLRKTELPLRPKSASDLLGMSMSTPSPLNGDDGLPTEPPFGFGQTSATNTPSPPLPATPTPSLRPQKQRAAWWLDVSCPTWKDLRDIGELLGLHPLTLEDVLHQDPREKLDIYDKLGYYFVVVRALDEQYFKYTPGSSTSAPPGAELATVGNGVGTAGAPGAPGVVPATPVAEPPEPRRRGWGFGRQTGRAAAKSGEKVEIVEDPAKEGIEGIGVGGVNLYLVVFQDGIVSFHYDDVSKHTKRVLERVTGSTGNEATSDWIAHGLIDSIVDAFFPLTGYVDGAVDDMDSLTIDPTTDPREPATPPPRVLPSDDPFLSEPGEPGEWIEMDEKSGTAGQIKKTTASTARALKQAANARNFRGTTSTRSMSHFQLAMLYLKLVFLPIATAKSHTKDATPKDVFDRSAMLKSIANMRRLVTGLSRMLGGKNAVVTSLLKRASENGRGSDQAVYLSDVHDHILLLQTSLYHYEYILAHCQPAYLSYLNVSIADSRSGTDRLILALSTVAIGILPMQLPIGLGSMNISRPGNSLTGDKYWYFIGICILITLMGCVMVLTVRYWRWAARKKWTKLRGGELPSSWDGFWGWA